MEGSIERVRAVIHGQLPDRPPLYDLLRNDAVIEHFTGQALTVDNGADLVYRAYEPAVDATRPLVRAPQEEGIDTLEDGRSRHRYRWTTWTEHKRYPSSRDYEVAKRRELDQFAADWNASKQQQMSGFLVSVRENKRALGEVFFFPSARSVGLMGIYGEVGLEHFSYYLADCHGVIDEQLEIQTLNAVAWVEHLPEDHGIEAVFVGDDIAFKTGPIFSPAWMAEHYFPRLDRLIKAYHHKAIKVLFHSDGNLNAILEGLVNAGIDGLNPIEIMAGMNVGDIHRRYPHLFLAGGIDVSQLLPFGTPQQVRDTVRATIEAAEGRILVGSSTELDNQVPLANYRALREAVLEAAH